MVDCTFGAEGVACAAVAIGEGVTSSLQVRVLKRAVAIGLDAWFF